MFSSFDEVCSRFEGKKENRTFDIKGGLISASELVKQIQGGLNGIEDNYWVILGVQEDADKVFKKANLQPIVWSGNGAEADFDAFKVAISQSTRNNTIPYSEGLWNMYTLPVNGGEVVVVEVHRSPSKPHQNSNGRYYIRRDGFTDHMTHQEVTQEFTEEEDSFDSPHLRIEPGVIASLSSHEMFTGELVFAGGPQLQVWSRPLTPQPTMSNTELISSLHGNFYPFGYWRDGDFVRIPDGYLTWALGETRTETFSYLTAQSNGEVFGVSAQIVNDGNLEPTIERFVCDALGRLDGALNAISTPKITHHLQIGAYGTMNTQLKLGPGVRGTCLNDHIVKNLIWDRESMKVENISREFAEKVFDEYGLKYPR